MLSQPPLGEVKGRQQLATTLLGFDRLEPSLRSATPTVLRQPLIHQAHGADCIRTDTNQIVELRGQSAVGDQGNCRMQIAGGPA
jgi:hypothetical protein